ncbi:MAG: BON domain-containing protein [Edaphobacter sp.]|uniref:BON domain-containing protein n=1 Tax=Edaphobacter sp. TaxID=1934404 RepID=UPI00239A64AA|nr:BON domain-containing protein [Edaphobacter sp.]MDE1177392.1 BON domain-containing protein [Edaphobacter sp.]
MTPLQFPDTADERILCDLMRQITWQSDIDARHIRVEVRDGIVYLRGSVQTCIEVVEADHAAQAVYGVNRVVNHLEVLADRHRADHEIARELAAALRNTTSVLDHLPTHTVVDGVVTLHGVCRWEFQRLCAERTALSIIGVQSVVNRIAVDPNARPSVLSVPNGPCLVGKAS